MQKPLMLALSLAVLAGGCSSKSNRLVDNGNGVPQSDARHVVTRNGSTVQQVVDDKGNPVLRADGTPQTIGRAPGVRYQGTVPPRFLGAWAISPDDCTSGAGHTRIRVGERTVVFYENVARVKTVADDSQQTATLNTEMTGSGTNSPQTQKMTLSPDGKTLIYERGKDMFRYGRCGGGVSLAQ